MTNFDITGRNKIKRKPDRGHYDQETVYAIVDEALICHVGMVDDGQPVVIPTIHARIGDSIVLHGAKASRLLKYVGDGHQVCITVTHVDGLVLARSVFHHSMNYRSAVIFGSGYVIEDPDERIEAMRAITEHLVPGRWDDARQPTSKEDNATALVKINIEAASAKIRIGPPGDDDEDYGLPVWAGVIPVKQAFLSPEPDSALADGIEVPEYIEDYSR
jgi:nitroimidazol reductase NimA-like FMN-containing flavoprotein (pyridoxamine 5'-phosphate oxidase superfamily)